MALYSYKLGISINRVILNKNENGIYRNTFSTQC